MSRIWIKIQNSDLKVNVSGISLYPMLHDHVTYFLLLSLKTIPTCQHKYFNMFFPHSHVSQKNY